MIVALLDTISLGTAVTLGVALGRLTVWRRRAIAAEGAVVRHGRAEAATVGGLGVAQCAVTIARASLAGPVEGAAWLPLAGGLLIGVLAIGAATRSWRRLRGVAGGADATVARSGDDEVTAASVPAPGETPRFPSSPPSRRHAGESSEEATTDARDAVEFDMRLVHANRMQSIGRLAGGIAHDFNNLLTSILTSAEMAREAIPEEHGIRPDLEEIRRAGTRAGELTRQLLAFARRDVSRPRVIDVNMLAGSLATMLRRLLGETISLRITLGEDLPLVLADPAQLEQVIVNLAVNARDAMPQGGELQLRTARGGARRGPPATAPRTGVVLEVQDSGSGMSEEVRTRLFEPFYTTKTAGRGTGLGLATCQAIVAAHGGEIEVDSAPGRGSTFRVWFPATEEVSDSRGTQEHPAPPGPPRDAPATILLVEDDPDVRGSTARALRRAGYRVLDAIDGTDALEQAAAATEPIDLVITDIVMPRMGGAELVRRLAPRSPAPEVLFMSGYPSDSPEVAQVEATGAHVLEKPYTPAILLFEVRLKLDAARRAGRP